MLAADMLGLEGLKEVVEMVLTRDYCRFFPKVSLGSRGQSGVSPGSWGQLGVMGSPRGQFRSSQEELEGSSV